MTSEEIGTRFTYHTPSEAGVNRHARLSLAFISLAELVDEIVREEARLGGLGDLVLIGRRIVGSARERGAARE